MEQFEAPAERPSGYPPAMLWLIACLALGGVGAFMTCWSGFGMAWGQLAPQLGGMPPEQAAALEQIRAEQGWWVVPLAAVQLLLKMALSVGLVAGAGLCLARRPAGPGLMRPVLVFGVVFELGTALYGVVYTLLNRERMGEQFGRSMAASPGIDPQLAEQAGGAFAIGMVIMVVVAMLWAIAKAGLYLGTRGALAPTEA